jgi:type VI secretion system protein ImpL
MLKYVFGAIFVGLAWAAVLVFEQLPTWPAWVVSAVVAVVLALIAVLRLLKARQAAGAIESGLAGGGRTGRGIRPELQAQVQAMRAEFEKALRSLKTSRAGKHGGNALSVLPWYVIIGPPGGGKSTVLRNSGLRFPYLSAKKGAVKGIGGTRNCDWWLSNDAILLDTAGRWATENEDSDEWLSFLDLLKKSRGRKAVNGVLIAVSVDQLAGGETEIGDLAAALRERVDELQGRLGVSAPIYLLITKCDLLAGFTETFSSLSESDRAQIWGLTLPFDAPVDERTDLFVERLDELLSTLEVHSVKRLGEERRLEERERIHQLPQEFEEMCPNLVALVKDLFAENVYADTPILRGVYFTSGTQEGHPLDRIMKRMAEAFGLMVRPSAPDVVRTKAYFLADVFKRVVFPDQDAVALSGGARKQERVMGWAMAGGSLALAAGIAAAPILAYSQNASLVKDTRALVAGLAAARTANGDLTGGKPLEDLAPIVDRLWELQQHGPSLSMTFGFYQGDRLAEPVAWSIRRQVIVPAAARDLDVLRTLPAARTVGIDDAYSRLSRYLLLSSPRAAEEPRPAQSEWNERIVPQVREGLIEAWQRRAAAEKSPVTPLAARTLARLVDLYFVPARTNERLWLERDEGAVVKARAALRAMSRQDPFKALTTAPELAQHDLSLGKLLGGAMVLLREDAKVDGAFTRAGHELVQARLNKLEEGEAITGGGDEEWVIGPRRALSKGEVAAIQTRYFEQYEQQWRALLVAVHPKGPTDLSDALALLRRHQEEQPLNRILKALADNLRFDSKADQLAGALGDKAVARVGGKNKLAGAALAAQRPGPPAAEVAIRARFAPLVSFGVADKEGAVTPLDVYYKQLAGLQQALVVYEESRATAALRKETTVAKQQVTEQTERYGKGVWQPTLSKMLMPLISGVEDLVVGASTETANRLWCDAVVLPFDEVLRDRYPFQVDGTDAPIAEVEKFFQPKAGTLWAYYEDQLKADIELVGKRFRVKERAALQYRRGIPEFLSSALRISETLFPPGADKMAPRIEIRLKAASGPGGTVSRVIFRVGGAKPFEYGNWTERWEPLVWPARGAKLSLLGQIPGLPRDVVDLEGDWAFMRMLTGGDRSVARDDQEFLHVRWTLSNPVITARMDVRPPNLLDISKFSLPRSVTPGASSCGP